MWGLLLADARPRAQKKSKDLAMSDRVRKKAKTFELMLMATKSAHEAMIKLATCVEPHTLINKTQGARKLRIAKYVLFTKLAEKYAFVNFASLFLEGFFCWPALLALQTRIKNLFKQSAQKA